MQGSNAKKLQKDT